MSGPRGSRSCGDDGAIAVVVAIFTVVMFAFAALVVDLGIVRDLHRQAQVVADVSALAGAGVLTSDGGSRAAAFAAARSKVLANWPAGETPVWSSCPPPTDGWVRWPGDASGTWCIVFHPTEDQVRVVAPTRTSPSFFGGLVGYSGAEVSASAEAGASDQLSGDPACVVCVLEDGRTGEDGGSRALTVDDGSLTVAGGDLRVAGDLRVEGTGTVRVTGGTPRLRGQVTPRNRLGQVQPTPGEGAGGSFDDPLASSPLPSSSGPRKANPCVDGPGTYEKDVELKGVATCTLARGVYVVEGRWRVEDSARLSGTGVLLYLRGSGRLELRDFAQVSLSAPESPRAVLVYDRSSSQGLRVDGSARLAVTGTVHAPRAQLRITGGAQVAMRSLVVVGRLDLDGDARLSVAFDPAENVPVPASTRRLPALIR